LQIQYHISKLFWTAADKGLFIIYGFFYLIQISLLKPADLGLYGILLAINTWIYVISDSFALQVIIQFGFNESSRSKANTFALIFHISIVMIGSLIFALFGSLFADVFNESRFLEITTALPLLSLLMLARTFCSKFLLRDHEMQKIFWVDFVFFGTMAAWILYYKLTVKSISLDQSIIIYYLGAFVSSMIAIILTFKNIKLGFNGSLPLKKILNFTIPFTIANALNTFPKYLDIIVLKIFFSLEVIGIYQAAKSLFKFFEEGVSGANGLIYPASVRYYETNDKTALHSLITKSLSFLLFAYLFASIILLSGFADLLVTLFMKLTYIKAVGYFKILLISTLFLPFTSLNFIITASGKHKLLLRNVFFAFIASVITYIIIGFSNLIYLLPLGYITYYMVLTVINVSTVENIVGIKIKFTEYFRALFDSANFIKGKFRKK
jgi:O-antigen/teichoic acid export membrane protein